MWSSRVSLFRPSTLNPEHRDEGKETNEDDEAAHARKTRARRVLPFGFYLFIFSSHHSTSSAPTERNCFFDHEGLFPMEPKTIRLVPVLINHLERTSGHRRAAIQRFSVCEVGTSVSSRSQTPPLSPPCDAGASAPSSPCPPCTRGDAPLSDCLFHPSCRRPSPKPHRLPRRRRLDLCYASSSTVTRPPSP